MRCVWTAAVSVLAVLAWQALVVRSEFHGNWTALFCTGALLEQPPALAAEEIYRFEGSRGYDGQFYHYVAHDPFFQHGLAAYIDMPQWRYRRILVPLAAYLLAFGRSELIDRAYIAVVLAFVFLGTYWLSCYLLLHGFDPGWGAAFVVIPGVLISIDRLTIDIALIAFSVALALYFERGEQGKLFATLAAASLVRETGLVLVAAYVVYLALHREWRKALLSCTAALPALAWYSYVALHTAFSYKLIRFSFIPLEPLARRLAKPIAYPLPPLTAFAATALDYVAYAGIILAIGIGYAAFRRSRQGIVETGLFAFALIATFAAPAGGWTETYAYARWLAPLPLFAALDGIRTKRWMHVLPIVLIVPRVVLQLMPHVVAIVRWVGV